ncbi:MAG: hypothetical protein EXS64_21040 [Candidatus Latescibacteria bacterium]|nr:hypothetical protein [Candidatus Latescibacterota bacterium]
MLSDLLEDRRCRCGSRSFSRLWGDESRTRLSFVLLCEGCGHLERTTYSDSGATNPPAITTTSPN